MKHTHGGKREGAGFPSYPFKTKDIRLRVTGAEYLNYGLENESYDEFFTRIESAIKNATNNEYIKKQSIDIDEVFK